MRMRTRLLSPMKPTVGYATPNRVEGSAITTSLYVVHG